MKNARFYILLIIILATSLVSTACIMWVKEGFIYSAVMYMEGKYHESFENARIWIEDSVKMAPKGNSKIQVVVEYNDFYDTGRKEWGDNYLYYLHKDEIYKDAKEVIDSVYENNKVYIHINDVAMPSEYTIDTDIIELYKRGTFIVYVYTDKDIEDKDTDVLKIQQGMHDKQMNCVIRLYYLRTYDFTKMSEDKIDTVSGYEIYNASTNIYMRTRQEISWRYGDFKKELE